MNKITLTILALATSVFAFAADDSDAKKTCQPCQDKECQAACEKAPAQKQVREQRMAKNKMSPEMKKNHIRAMLLRMSDAELADVEAQIAEVKKLSVEERAEAAKAALPAPKPQQRKQMQKQNNRQKGQVPPPPAEEA